MLRLHPVIFGLVVAAFYAVAMFPGLRRAQYDPSVFIVAGDRFVDRQRLDSPIIVRNHSDGYDGEFYYRLAIDPWPAADGSHGVTPDSAAARGQRILYPLIAWTVSFGNAKLVPAALVLVNLVAVGVAAAAATGLARAASLSRWVPFAIALWPGFTITVTHDTTELVPQAFVLLALWAFAVNRIWLFALLAGVAPLAREVNLLLPASFFLWSTAAALRQRSPASFRLVIACALAMAPCLVWRETLAIALQSPVAASSDIGWPGLGWLQTVERIVAGIAGRPAALAVLGVAAVTSAGFVVLVASHLPTAVRHRSIAPVTLAWSSLAILMALLTAGGPWTDAVAIFRAFTECFVLGIVVLGMARTDRRVAVPLLCVLAALWLLIWRVALGHIVPLQ